MTYSVTRGYALNLDWGGQKSKSGVLTVLRGSERAVLLAPGNCAFSDSRTTLRTPKSPLFVYLHSPLSTHSNQTLPLPTFDRVLLQKSTWLHTFGHLKSRQGGQHLEIKAIEAILHVYDIESGLASGVSTPLCRYHSFFTLIFTHIPSIRDTAMDDLLLIFPS